MARFVQRVVAHGGAPELRLYSGFIHSSLFNELPLGVTHCGKTILPPSAPVPPIPVAHCGFTVSRATKEDVHCAVLPLQPVSLSSPLALKIPPLLSSSFLSVFFRLLSIFFQAAVPSLMYSTFHF